MGEITYIDKHRKSTTEDEAGKLGTIHCLVININNEQLLLPNASVTEVVNYMEPEAVAEAPEWLLGLVSWRERRIPLVSFERISQSNEDYPGTGDRIVICNSLNGNRNVPYVGIVAQGIPHLHLVKEQSLVTTADITTRQCVVLSAGLDGSDVMIPNLDDIESRIQALQS